MFFDQMITLTQGLQIAALVPCLFVIIYLLTHAKNNLKIILPVFYFLALASNLYIETGFDFNQVNPVASYLSIFLTELSFLMIIWFMFSAIPSFIYYLILLVPLVIGSLLMHIGMDYDTACIAGDCMRAYNIYLLYHVISSALVFLVLTFIVSSYNKEIIRKDPFKVEKYWLIITLIFFNLIFITSYLLELNGSISREKALIIRASVSLGFIYMVLTSLFRVFVNAFNLNRWRPSDFDRKLAAQIEKIIITEKSYRKTRFTRKTLANQLKVSERTLSKVLNWKFGKSFPDLVNDLRIEEAKKLLDGSEKSVTTIAYDLGFSRITSFNRVFKQKTGVSASEFRKKVI